MATKINCWAVGAGALHPFEKGFLEGPRILSFDLRGSSIWALAEGPTPGNLKSSKCDLKGSRSGNYPEVSRTTSPPPPPSCSGMAWRDLGAVVGSRARHRHAAFVVGIRPRVLWVDIERRRWSVEQGGGSLVRGPHLVVARWTIRVSSRHRNRFISQTGIRRPPQRNDLSQSTVRTPDCW